MPLLQPKDIGSYKNCSGFKLPPSPFGKDSHLPSMLLQAHPVGRPETHELCKLCWFEDNQLISIIVGQDSKQTTPSKNFISGHVAGLVNAVWIQLRNCKSNATTVMRKHAPLNVNRPPQMMPFDFPHIVFLLQACHAEHSEGITQRCIFGLRVLTRR